MTSDLNISDPFDVYTVVFMPAPDLSEMPDEELDALQSHQLA